jgi:hypothetical protein
MRHRLTLALGVIGLAMTIPASIASQQKLTPAPDLRLPPYDNKYVLEITPARLDELETKLKSFPDDAAVEKKSKEASTAKVQWKDCRDKEEAALRAQGRPQAEKDKAQVKANSEEMKKLGKEMEERLKGAKSPEEMQMIMAEYQPKMQALMPQSAQATPENIARHTEAQNQAKQQIVSKCGTEPPAAAESKRLEASPPGVFLMIERLVGLCGQELTYVGPDGSLSNADWPYNSTDKGMSHTYNVEIYSPAEVKQRPRCSRLMPLIESRGKALGKDY